MLCGFYDHKNELNTDTNQANLDDVIDNNNNNRNTANNITNNTNDDDLDKSLQFDLDNDENSTSCNANKNIQEYIDNREYVSLLI